MPRWWPLPEPPKTDRAHRRPDGLQNDEAILVSEDRDDGQEERADQIQQLVRKARGSQAPELTGCEGEQYQKCTAETEEL